MSKRKKREPKEQINYDANISTHDIDSRMTQSRGEYAIENNQDSIPDHRDGLRVVYRRILYTAMKRGVIEGKNGSKIEKVHTIGGDVMGTLHPHGDTSINNAIVKLGQSHSFRHPLIKNQGDFGSQESGNSAAPRYLEAQLSKFAYDVYLKDYSECPACVNHNAAYKGDGYEEPEVLPVRLPAVLVTGTMSIGGGGYATKTPPHTIGTVIDATKKYIENKKVTNAEICDTLRIDYPTGGIIVNKDAIRDCYVNGTPGSVRIRSTVKYEEDENMARVVELPFGTTTDSIKDAMQKFQENDPAVASMIDEFADGSDKNGIDIRITAKEGVDIKNLMYKLFMNTPLEKTEAISFCLLKQGYPRDGYSPLKIISEWHTFRVKTLIRKFNLMHSKLNERLVVLDGIEHAVINNRDKFFKILRTQKNTAHLMEMLQKQLKLNELQAFKISLMKISALSAADRDKIKIERKDIKEKLKWIKKHMDSPKLIETYIVKELDELKEKYQCRPKTKLINLSVTANATHPDIDYELEIVDNWIVKRPLTEVRTTSRGTKGVKSVYNHEALVKRVNNTDLLIMFTNQGRTYKTFCYDIHLGKKMPITTFVPLNKGERVVSVVQVPKGHEFGDDRVVIATTKGQVKANYLSAFCKSRRDAVMAIKLDGDEEVFSVNSAKADDYLVIASNAGLGIVYPVDDITIFKTRNSKAMKAIKDLKGSRVISACIAPKDFVKGDGSLLLVKADGYGKRLKLSDVRIKRRGGAPTIMIRCDRENELRVVTPVHEGSKSVQIYSSTRTVNLKVENIPHLNRTTVGRKLMDVGQGDSVIGAIVV
jgi:DNA gyrase subunit A